MFNLSPKWNFPSNNHSQIIGIADSGVEMFKGTPIKSLAREICQNSLDARLDDSQPARIEFETFEIDPKNIPGAKTLEDVFKRCLDFWQIQDSDQARKFFKQAIKDMNRSSIKCLRISDFNTSGLTGSRAEYNSPEVVAAALAKRHSPLNMRTFEELDNKRRELLAQVEALKAERNRASAEVARLKRNGEDAEAFIASLSDLSSRISALDSATEAVKADLADWMLTVPNIPDASVPDGVDENDNVEVHRWGTPREFDFEVKNHWDLSNDNGGLDFERGAKLAGSRFTVSWGWAARLERALVCFYLDFHHEQGRTEILPPLMVNRKTMQGTGQLPKFEEDLFKVADWEYYLIPTAEVPVTNLHADEILDEEALPKRYCSQTPCFRSEAGSAGKDTRGYIRQHQFTKVEMV